MKIFHLVDQREIADKATADRIWKCQESWEDLYFKNLLIPVHVWEGSYPRNAKDALGDPRPSPFFKDLLTKALEQCDSSDGVLWTNSDNLIHKDLPEYLRYQLSVHGPCSIMRTEFRGSHPSQDVPAEFWGRQSTEKHIGRDGFCFPAGWLRERLDELPDFALSYKAWDIHLACIIRLHYDYKTTNKNIWDVILPAEIPLGYLGHLAHKSAWLKDINSPGNLHNGKLFREWASKYLPDLKVTAVGDLA